MCVAHTRRTTTTYNYLKSRLSAIDTAGFFKGHDNNENYSAVSYSGWFLQRSIKGNTRRRTTTTYDYLKYRLSAIDTAGFFKGEWKENYYVCGVYKKNDNNVQLPHISAVSYRYGWFLQRSMERELLCVWRIQEEERQQRTTTTYLGCQL